MAPEMSRLFGVPVSFEKPVVAKLAEPLGADGAVIVNPLTLFATSKFPLPQLVFVHVTAVLEIEVTIQFRLLVARAPAGKSVDVGPLAPVTPLRPVNVIRVGLVKRLQLSNGAKVRLYVHVGGPAVTSVKVTA
jgi:hypothetical protein